MENTENMNTQKRKSKGTKIAKYIMWLLMAVQLVASCLLLFKLFKLNMVPIKYMVCAIVVLLCIDLLTLVAGKKIWSSVIMSVLAVILAAVMLYGFNVLNSVHKTIENITDGADEQTTEMVIVVLAANETTQLSDMSEYRIGFFDGSDADATDALKKEINAAVGTTPSYIAYDDLSLMAKALYEKDVDALIMNKGHFGVLEGMSGYADFESKIKVIYSSEIKTKVEIVKEEDDNLDTFIVYISGIDQYGSVNVIRNSDVNILMIVNTKTRHVQLINTPRDYYVSIPLSDTWKDKLTHAGCYGIDCSIGTMEMLYDIDIDYYVRMNFSGFEKIIDALGGVDVYSEYEFTTGMGQHFTKGINHLTGKTALMFARERHAFAKGDRQRGKNQMAVINAMISKMSSKEFLYNYSNVLNGISDSFLTNMTSEEIYSLVRIALAGDLNWKVDTYSVDGKGDNLTMYSSKQVPNYVMIPDESTVTEAKRIINSVLSEE